MTTKEGKPKRSRARGSKAPATVAPEGAEAPATVRPDASAEAPGAAGQTAAPTGDPSEVTSAARDAVSARDASFADLTRIVVFVMEGQRYALPIEAVQEIQQLVAISEMPGSGGAVLGVINLRGQVIPAIDMRTLVGLTPVELGLETPMVLAYTAYGLVALIVDEVEDVVEVPPDSMQPPSPVHALADRLLGVCRLEDGLVFVFDMDVIVPPEMAVAGVTST